MVLGGGIQPLQPKQLYISWLAAMKLNFFEMKRFEKCFVDNPQHQVTQCEDS